MTSGGKRLNSGRKPLDPKCPSVYWNLRLTISQKAKAYRLGGPAWVRKQIDKAKEPS